MENRVVGLDIFRVLLTLLVFMFHSKMHINCQFWVLNPFVSVGAIAMTGFFLLSGYSLRLAYGEKYLMDIKEMSRFYIRRLLAILPLYYSTALIYILFVGEESSMQNLVLFPIEVFGLQSTFSSLSSLTHNGGTWFISCLLLGYLFYPFIQTVIRQIANDKKVLLLFVLGFVDLWAVVIQHYFSTFSIYDNPFYRLLEFSIGALIAEINMTENGKVIRMLRNRKVLFIVAGFLIIAVSIAKYFAGITDYMLLNWIALPCFVLLLFPLGIIRIPRLEKSKLLNYLCKISYPFFMVQFFAWKSSKWFFNMTGYDQNWIRISYSFLFTLIISSLMYEIVQVRLVRDVKRIIHI